MQAVATLKDYSRGEQKSSFDKSHALMEWISGIFGCAHKEMSRPFSRHGEAYRVCIACGAQRRFDQTSWKSRGPYYYKPARTAELQEIDRTALRLV